MPIAGRNTTQWFAVQQRVYRSESTCWLCGEPVDQSLRRHPMSRSVDHLVQLSHGGSPHDRNNLHLAHAGCNAARGNRLRIPRRQCACQHGLPCGRLSAKAAVSVSVDLL